MAEAISRYQRSIKGLAATTSATTTPAIPFENWSSGIIRIPAAAACTTLTFYTSVDSPNYDPNATINYEPLYSQTNVAVTLTVGAGRQYAFPADCFGAGAIKIVVDSASTIDVSLKG